jgi:predicted anti-sigma-YlaC factor YlaD
MRLWFVLAPSAVAMAALAFLSGPESSCGGSDTITIGFDVAVLIAAASALAKAVVAIVLRRLWPFLAAVLLAILGYFLVIDVVGNCLA